jgi:hypothetical protein
MVYKDYLKTITFCLFVSLIFISCGTSFKKVQPHKIENIKPELNKSFIIEIGESLIENELSQNYDAIILDEDLKPESYYVDKKFRSGDMLIKTGESIDYYLYEEIKSQNQNINVFGIALGKGNKENMMYSTSNSHSIKLLKLKNDVKYKKNDYKISNDYYFKQVFIYNGKVGNGVKFIYREFINNIARPAFQQDLQYDLLESNIIGFKGLRIEIINVTNTSIEYKISNSFTKI